MDSSIKSKIDKIWLTLHTAGITNPLTVAEQLTYLFFIKMLDDHDILAEKNELLLGIHQKRFFDDKHQDLRWSKFKDFNPEKMYMVVQTKVFPFIKELSNDKNSGYAKYMKDAVFMIPTPVALQRLVEAIDKLPLEDKDSSGDLYEYILSKLSTAGVNGQFRTPRHIIDMMVNLVSPTP